MHCVLNELYELEVRAGIEERLIKEHCHCDPSNPYVSSWITFYIHHRASIQIQWARYEESHWKKYAYNAHQPGGNGNYRAKLNTHQRHIQ